jgi:hypothetical protein
MRLASVWRGAEIPPARLGLEVVSMNCPKIASAKTFVITAIIL